MFQSKQADATSGFVEVPLSSQFARGQHTETFTETTTRLAKEGRARERQFWLLMTDAACLTVATLCFMAHLIVVKSCWRLGLVKAPLSLEVFRVCLSVVSFIMVAAEGAGRRQDEAVDPRARVAVFAVCAAAFLSILQLGPDVSPQNDAFANAVRLRFRHNSWDMLIIQAALGIAVLAWIIDIVGMGLYPARRGRKWVTVFEAVYWLTFISAACLKRTDSIVLVAIVALSALWYMATLVSFMAGNDAQLSFLPADIVEERRRVLRQ